uniref:Uncharacterized protein n=1 Tax=Photinus pyralis TaxID=7054 RepID=A0A1Y1K515_PHOPY
MVPGSSYTSAFCVVGIAIFNNDAHCQVSSQAALAIVDLLSTYTQPARQPRSSYRGYHGMGDATATLNSASIKPPASLFLLGQIKMKVAWFLPELLFSIS